MALLVAGQLAAFWLLCTVQVRRAQAREAVVQVQRVAVAECMQYVPRATLNSCAARVDVPAEKPAGVERASLSSALSAGTSMR